MKNVSVRYPMKNASALSVDDERSALHDFYRALGQARALGRPGGGRGKLQRKNERFAEALPIVAFFVPAGRQRVVRFLRISGT